MLTVLLGAAAVVGLFYYYVVRPLRYWKDRGVEQGNPAWIFGHMWDNIIGKCNGAELFQNLYHQSAKLRYTGMYRFSTPVLFLRDPELIKQITVKDFDSFTDHTTLIPAECDRLWSKNLFNLTGSKWREMRNHLSPSFTGSKMRVIFGLMAECAQNFQKHLLEKDEEIITVEMRDLFSRYTNDVIATTAFGVKVDSLTYPDNEFYQMGKEVADFGSLSKTIRLLVYFLIPLLRYFMKIRFISDEVGTYFRTIIEDTIKIREEKGIVRPDMLHLLIQARKEHHANKEKPSKNSTEKSNGTVKDTAPNAHLEITNEDITANALIFFIAGFESASSFVTFTSYELAINPDIQEKLRAEVLTTLEQCKGDVTYDVITSMKYMDMVLSESLRKWPSFVALSRICTKPYTIQPVLPGEKPIRLEKGAEISIPLHAIQHDPQYFPDPERFDPERFSEENKDNIHPYTYLPFGIGPRNCIGSRFTLLEAKVVLFYLLSRFEIVPLQRTAIPLKLVKRTLINFKSVDGFWLGLKRCAK